MKIEVINIQNKYAEISVLNIRDHIIKNNIFGRSFILIIIFSLNSI